MIRRFDEITKQPTFIHTGFDEPVLYAPARLEQLTPCNSLKIVTAFTDCERISTHMINLADGIKSSRFVKGMSVDILLGMTKSSLFEKAPRYLPSAQTAEFFKRNAKGYLQIYLQWS